MTVNDVHVVPDPQGWAVQSEGIGIPGTVYSTKEEAIERAGAIAREAQVDIVVHEDQEDILEVAEDEEDSPSGRESVATIDPDIVADPMVEIPGLAEDEEADPRRPS